MLYVAMWESKFKLVSFLFGLESGKVCFSLVCAGVKFIIFGRPPRKEVLSTAHMSFSLEIDSL